MKRFALLTIAFVASTASALAKSHASREAVIAFLRREGILDGKTVVAEAIWDEKAHWWSISLRHPSAKITNWTVDADGRDYHYVCQH